MGGPPQYLHFGFVFISVANLIAIILLIVVFAIAVSIRFPGERPGKTLDDRGEASREEDAA